MYIGVRPTRPKIRVGLVLHVLHGSGAYGWIGSRYSADVFGRRRGRLLYCLPRSCLCRVI